MQSHITTLLLGIQDVEVIGVAEDKHRIIIDCTLRHDRVCPHCGSSHAWVHDHREQVLRDAPMRRKHVFLRVRKTRYDCKGCGMRFEAPLSFAAKGKQMTKRLIAYVVDAFRDIRSVAELSKEIGISTTSIFRIVACLFVPRKRLPRVFCMDEFKGDSGGSKYQTTLADGEAKEIVDIPPTRYSKDLDAYFSSIDREERQGVAIFVSDMCGTFKGVKENFFPKSIHVIDRYHFIRQVHWALENVRKREQKRMTVTERKWFKRSRSLLKKPAQNLTETEKGLVATMLEKSDAIRTAYILKEGFYTYVLSQQNKEAAATALSTWIEEAKKSGLKEWRYCLRAYRNWFDEITNSFNYPWNNGYIEGTHNKIKTVKRVAFGMRNFHHFRTKLLLVCSKDR
ncbi:ISL3 family transposase [Aedoeadaptatus coxii]|uniref:ISL3 family transposase n=1 Tax=Aedoeadaptatus coxii TaxID=755172 RepID=UPI002AD32C5D|nr:ISL3 family transposase [Peptoniphilus coxii]